ncbi:hypothetical protein GGR56DRAFT_686185 [Xylariaceae sp. FL0804]|nr:hypothetical protein GGR56DRAFT_686185 [Xylariaceae sp. FL0804]
MDALPIELLRLIYGYCDPESVQSLRATARTLALVGNEYLLSPHFTSVNWRNDIERLHHIAHHELLRHSITSVSVFLGELSEYDAWSTSWAQHYYGFPEERTEHMSRARIELDTVKAGRKRTGPLHLRADALQRACSALPNLKDFEVTFTRCPLNFDFFQEVLEWPNCRRLDRLETYSNLDAIISALHGVRLSSFKIDRLPLEIFRLPDHRNHWFTHAQSSFDSLSQLNLTLDPSGLQGPSSSKRAVTGLGRMLQLATRLRYLKLAFHPYSSQHSKFIISFSQLFFGFTYAQLAELVLEGVSCDEEDLKDFLGRHSATLLRLRLGGRGLAAPCQVSLGGVHLYIGTFKSLFASLRTRLPKLERMHLEGIFECEHHDLPSHEEYNFYPLTDEAWEPLPQPGWVRDERKTISCLPFEQYVLGKGTYPGHEFSQQGL